MAQPGQWKKSTVKSEGEFCGDPACTQMVEDDDRDTPG